MLEVLEVLEVLEAKQSLALKSSQSTFNKQINWKKLYTQSQQILGNLLTRSFDWNDPRYVHMYIKHIYLITRPGCSLNLTRVASNKIVIILP